jgi:hypothetical protein
MLAKPINLQGPNKPHAAKPAMAFWFHSERLWRGLADAER